MLQEFLPGQRPAQTLGTGVNVCFICEDALALYREFKSRGVQTRTRPFAGNRLLVVPVTDPDDTALNSRARPMHPRKANLKNSAGILSGSRSGVRETRRFPAATLSKSIGPRSVPKELSVVNGAEHVPAGPRPGGIRRKGHAFLHEAADGDLSKSERY